MEIKTTVKYLLSEELPGLERIANEVMKSGYIPMGPPVPNGNGWMQPMIFRGKPCKEESRLESVPVPKERKG